VNNGGSRTLVGLAQKFIDATIDDDVHKKKQWMMMCIKKTMDDDVHKKKTMDDDELMT
jgi:hypothetical protein